MALEMAKSLDPSSLLLLLCDGGRKLLAESLEATFFYHVCSRSRRGYILSGIVHRSYFGCSFSKIMQINRWTAVGG